MKYFPFAREAQPMIVSKHITLGYEQFFAEAERFRRIASLAWSPRSIYPKNEYLPGSPEGHCGVTNFGFGIWLDWRGLLAPDRMSYQEGKITKADYTAPVGNNHTWLNARLSPEYETDFSVSVDLAGDQFTAISAPVVLQDDDRFVPDGQTVYGNLVYQADASTALLKYDVGRFAGRLGAFMCSVCSLSQPEDARFTPAEVLVRWGLTQNFTTAAHELQRAQQVFGPHALL